MGKVGIVVQASVALGRWDEEVFEGQRDHQEGDDEKDAADDDPARFRNLQLRLLAHVDAEQVGLQESLPGEKNCTGVQIRALEGLT